MSYSAPMSGVHQRVLADAAPRRPKTAAGAQRSRPCRCVHEMMKRIPIVLLGCLAAGCATRPDAPEVETVRGILEHFPSNVRSSHAWHGHCFMVGSIPVIPTEEVPEKTLRKFVGVLVIVQGVWHPGEKWTPSEQERNLPMPVDPDREEVIRGGGLKASSIGLVER